MCVHARLHLSAGLHVLIGFREMFHNNKRKKGLLSVLIYVLVSLSVCFACSYRFYLTWFKSTSHHQNFIIFSLRDEAYTFVMNMDFSTVCLTRLHSLNQRRNLFGILQTVQGK